ncbi:MAG: metal-dependent hydrolase, partial [Proteobacteria bacterium]|nr:metal-dependent hydrolase [Pseudomonadota bacterium]
MKITYFGHSCFYIEVRDLKIIIDPFYDNQVFSPDPTHVLV